MKFIIVIVMSVTIGCISYEAVIMANVQHTYASPTATHYFLNPNRIHNPHLFTGQSHVRVMHSEVHALVKLPDPEVATGMHCWIVELDAQGENENKS